ncbi:MAG: TIGR03016 family PEP-CTERM system-associated outer membrane protein [Methylophilus sp.]|nr:TIGR03016 family PEP-CTERM system-associated outer membrane protein [Methylophilus sp.]
MSAAEPRLLLGRLLLGRLVLAALAATPAAPALAQLAPQMGAPVELGDLRRTFQRAYGPAEEAPPGERAWTIVPGIGMEVTATDNARGLTNTVGGGGKKGAELMTSITPSLLVSGATPRLRATLNFAPRLRYFLNNPRQNGIFPNLNATGRATIFQDLFFLNASASIAEYSRAGGLGGASAGRLGQQDRVQTTTYSITPELRHNFGDWGSFRAAHAYSVTNQQGQGLRNASPFAPALASGNTSTQTTDASFTSGQEFGRYNFTFATNRTKFNGVGVLKNALRSSTTLDMGYALTRTVTLLAQVGHQEIRYGGTRPIRVSGMIWNAGARWTPDPDSTMTLKYGRRDGGNSISFDGSIAPTARTRLSASYSEAMSSLAEELLTGAQRNTLSPSGITIDPITGMPVILNNNFAGAQGGASRVRRVSVSAVLTQDIDIYTISLNRDERISLSGDVPGARPNSSFVTASLGWQREIGPGVRGNAQFSYSTREAGPRVRQETMTFTSGLNWSLSETLTTRASYTYTRANSTLAGFGYAAHLLALGVQKNF